jgi:hypothetical protein
MFVIVFHDWVYPESVDAIYYPIPTEYVHSGDIPWTDCIIEIFPFDPMIYMN